MDDIKKVKTVPYLSSSKMGRVLQLASERNLNKVTPEYFKTYGFGKADAYLAINALKFLGLIDDKSKTTEVAKKFQLRGAEGEKEVEAVVRKAYKELFEATENPHELSKDDLVNEFMHKYDLTRRIANSAAPAFLKICEFAGLKEKNSAPMRVRKATASIGRTSVPTSGRKSEKQEEQKSNNGEYTPLDFAEGKMKLYLPTKILTEAVFGGELSDDLKSLTSTLTKFAEKYLVENSSNNDTQTQIDE